MPSVFHPVPLTVEIKLVGNHGGDPRITTVHYRYAATGYRPTVAQLLGLAGQWRDIVLPSLEACVTPGTSWQHIQATDINDATGARADLALIGPYQGTRTGNTGAGNVNVALAKHTTSRAQGEVGRLFVMDLNAGDIVDAIIQGVLSNLLTVLAQKLLLIITDGSGDNFIPVVASKKHASFAPITSISFDSISDELITRLKQHRKHRRHAAIT